MTVFAAVLWGTTGLTSRTLYGLSQMDPLSVGFIRLATGAPALLVIAAVVARGSLGPAARRHWRPLAAMGLAMAAYNGTFFAGIARTSVTAATLLAICSAPLFVAVLENVFLKEPVTLTVVLALGLGLAGTALLVGGQGGPELLRPDYALGNLLALAAGLAYALYALIGRGAAQAQAAPPATMAALSFSAAALWLAPPALGRGLTLPTSLPAWLAALYLGLVPTALAYVFYLGGLRRISATAASIAALAEPLTASVLAALVLGERLTPPALLGGGLLLGSLAALAWPGRKRPEIGASE